MRVVCLLVALAAGPATADNLPQAGDPTFQAAAQALAHRRALVADDARPKNVILFIADGAGPQMMTAIRLAAGQALGKPGEDHVLSFEAFPYLALAKTWNTDAQTPDSAGTGTAIMTGAKTRKGVIGVGPEVVRGDCAAALSHPVTTLGEIAEARGLATGIVTTTRITHATPAAFYAHSADRQWENDRTIPPGAPCLDIARQLTAFPFDLALGGGQTNFRPAGPPDNPTGLRADGRDLIAEWKAGAPGRAEVETAGALEEALADPPTQLLGLFSPGHMAYEADRATSAPDQPALSTMTEAAIRFLEGRGRGYLLMVEGGLIDPALHAQDLPRALIEGVEFDRAVAAAIRIANPSETLILVTSDHGHHMPPWSQEPRGAPVGGLDTWRAEMNPPGAAARAAGPRRPSLLDIARALTGRAPSPHSLVQVGGHDATDVAIYAQGPMAHLIGGTVEQTYLFHLIAYALGLLPP